MITDRNWNVVTLSFLAQAGLAVLFAASYAIIGWNDFSGYVGGSMTVGDGLDWLFAVLLNVVVFAFIWMLLASLPLYGAWLCFGHRSKSVGLAALAIGAVLTAGVLIALYLLRLRPSDFGTGWWGVSLAVVGCLVAYAPLWFARRDVLNRRPPRRSWPTYAAEMAAIVALVGLILALAFFYTMF
jgi:hypothetical protein